MLLLPIACQGPTTAKPDDLLGQDDSGFTLDTDTTELTDAQPCDTIRLEEQSFLARGSARKGVLAGCIAHRIVTAGAVNQLLSIVIEGEALLSVTDPAGHDLGAGPAVELWQSGEVYLDLIPPDDGSHPYTVRVDCLEGCDRRYTRYPIVMLHGFGAAGVFDGVDYYYGVRDSLEAQGYLVRNPTVIPFATSEERAVEWAAHLDSYLAEGLGRRFILLAHSQGGLDARHLASGLGRGDVVAAIDMIGTPNRGTVVADVLGGTIDDGYVDPAIIDLGAAAFASLYGLDDSGSLADNLAFLTTENIAAFNAANPDDPGVYYSSWAGITCGRLEPDCQDLHGGEVVEALLEPLYLILYAYGLEGDGMVDVASAQWGEAQGTVDADHSDEIGQFEDTDNPAFDHLTFYSTEIARLADLGY